MTPSRDAGDPARADRAADLHHRPAAQRHHVPAPADAGGSGQSRATRLADDLSLSARPRGGRDARRRGWRASCALSSGWLRSFADCTRSTPTPRRNAARSPRTCSAACGSTRTTASRRYRPGSMQARPFAGISVPQALPAAPAAPGRPARRWVLKCPDHLFALEAIRTVYPDARLVFVHRDPVKVLLSVAKLTEVLRRPFTRGWTRRDRPQESERWLDGTSG